MELDICKFCSQVQTKKDCVYETDSFIIVDTKSNVYPIHYLIIAKEHVSQECFLKVNYIELHDVLKLLIPRGYRLIANIGENSGQIEEHLHFHVFGGCPVRDLGI